MAIVWSRNLSVSQPVLLLSERCFQSVQVVIQTYAHFQGERLRVMLQGLNVDISKCTDFQRAFQLGIFR